MERTDRGPMKFEGKIGFQPGRIEVSGSRAYGYVERFWPIVILPVLLLLMLALVWVFDHVIQGKLPAAEPLLVASLLVGALTVVCLVGYRTGLVLDAERRVAIVWRGLFIPMLQTVVSLRGADTVMVID